MARGSARCQRRERHLDPAVGGAALFRRIARDRVILTAGAKRKLTRVLAVQGN